ncbi:MAG: flagellar hook-basal body complex protein FliE [Pseudomonadota bacterium]
MNANALAAARAYMDAATTATPGAGAATEAAAPTGFGQMVQDAVEGAMETGQKADAQMASLATGQGNMVDVVTAIAETEVVVETMVSVRDRMISAYQEVMNMPV